MEVSLSLVVGYKRKRPDTRGDKIEARMDSIGLLLVGSLIAVLIIVWVLPKILAALGLF